MALTNAAAMQPTPPCAHWSQARTRGTALLFRTSTLADGDIAHAARTTDPLLRLLVLGAPYESIVDSPVRDTSLISAAQAAYTSPLRYLSAQSAAAPNAAHAQPKRRASGAPVHAGARPTSLRNGAGRGGHGYRRCCRGEHLRATVADRPSQCPAAGNRPRPHARAAIHWHASVDRHQR